jgi:hypothetical protein
MPTVDEVEVFKALQRYRGTAKTTVGDSNVEITFTPEDNHRYDSPDFIFWIGITFTLFGEEVKVKIPVPLEAEKGGIFGGALLDLEKFITREKHVIELPMPVVAESGFQSREQRGHLPVNFSIVQLPVAHIEAADSKGKREALKPDGPYSEQ